MTLSLPPKNAPPTPEAVRSLHDNLTSVIWGHPQAVQPWTFYEELDAYLGPWGNAGYPIGYGKLYCVLFNGNEKLQRNPNTADWVRRTTIALQEPLRDLVLDRFRARTLDRLTEPELRAFAFNVHPQAYTRGGLSTVSLVAPELLPVIASIPSAEFNPRSPNFSSSVQQVMTTFGLVAPESTGAVIAAAAGPAHTGMMSRAVAQDRARFLQEVNWSRSLGETLRTVQSGEMDTFPLLTALTDRLNATEFSDPGLAHYARDVIRAADDRKRRIARTYRQVIGVNPSLQPALDRYAPGWSRW
jgi:hypothetical protein